MNNTLEELFNWFGHRKGGVKIAFTDRGNPTGNVVETDLILALNKWSEELDNTNSRALKVFFVGGPGNGKTEALDYAIKRVVKKFNLADDALKEIERQAKESKRTVEVEINNIGTPFKRIKLVQDASLGEIQSNAAMSMLNDYDTIVDDSTLYICCINRGILQDVLSLARFKEANKEFALFSQLAIYMDTTGEEIPNTWPIHMIIDQKHLSIAVWPMEVSSLFQTSTHGSDSSSAFQEVVKIAVGHSGWDALYQGYLEEKLTTQYCPLLSNLSLFQTNSGENIRSLISEYELLSNRKFTFREMLSLTVYLLVGHENDFISDGRPNQINAFISRELSNLRDYSKEVIGYESCFKLAMFQMEFKLFNQWPDITNIIRDTAWKKFLNQNRQKGKYKACDAFQKLFARPTEVVKRTDLEKTLQHLSTLIDPGKLYLDIDYNSDFNPGRIDLALQDSIMTLNKNLEGSKALSSIDKEVLKFFSELEQELDEIRTLNNINSINAVVERLNFILKKVTASYVKRKFGGYYGISSETGNIKKFRAFDAQNIDLRSVIDELLGINYISTIKGKPFGAINIAINSTFGQPDFSDQDVRYKSNIIYSVGIYQPQGKDCFQPISDSRFLKLSISYFDDDSKSFCIPLTYHFYNAIMDIKSGLKKGTMPRDIAATFDRMKSFMEGVSVHRKEGDSFLVFPNSKEIKLSDILKEK